MIHSFADSDTQQLFEGRSHRRWSAIRNVALRKLDQIEAASQLEDLRVPPGNHLEPLKGDRAGRYSIRINGQFRICFVWEQDGASEVEIVDYH